MRTLHFLTCVVLLCVALSWAPAARSATNEELNEVNRLHQSGSSAQALELADRWLATRPKDAQLRFAKGVILAETQRSSEAVDVFQQLTQDFPELAEPYNNLAAVHASRGEYDAARTALEQALRSNPAYATAQENLGDIYALLASRAYAKALALEPGNNLVATKLGLVKDLLGPRRVAAPPR
jgi:colicin import membrane protein